MYDFDRDTVSLGINMHSKGKVSMYKPGTRPENLASVQTLESAATNDDILGDSLLQTKTTIPAASATLTQ